MSLFNNPFFESSVSRWYFPVPPLRLGYFQILRTPLLPQFSNRYTIRFIRDHYCFIFVTSFNINGLDYPMIIIQVIDEPFQCEVGVVDVRLVMTLVVFFIQWLQEFLIEDVFLVHYLTQLVHLFNMLLNPPWDFGCSCIDWHWICLWKMGQVLKTFPITVRYMDGWITSPKIPCCPPPNYYWMVDVFSWILE